MDEIALEKLLRTRPGHFCDYCLANAVGLPSEDVKAAIFSRSRAFSRVYGLCGWCRRPKAVTALRLAA